MKVKAAYLRGELITFLRTVYPDGIPEQVIVRSFYDYNERDVIIAALEYLAEKGYAEKNHCQKTKSIKDNLLSLPCIYRVTYPNQLSTRRMERIWDLPLILVRSPL